jgi:toxin-antitoxin system PIN domain toxin
MTFLPDVNVWIALAVVEHKHYEPAAKWFDSVGDNDIAFCRVTQMGFLRLLTNTHVMKGDQFTPSGAWQLFDRLYDQAKAIFEPEPEQLEAEWRGFTRTSKPESNLWTDAYLAAFAEATGNTLVTFDRGVSRFKNVRVKIL